MEFACKASGSKLVLVLGHENCGAVKGAVDDVNLGNITPDDQGYPQGQSGVG
jgi:carbonic anhydrase